MQTGKTLGETELPLAGSTTPFTYEVADNRFIVVRSGTKLGTKKGGPYVAFALPLLPCPTRAAPRCIQEGKPANDTP